ncbi:MAG: transcription antitermination factor NusB [Chitinophagales bacterium]|nr:transcription antitermination factor NusB [Saprospirales bacterium]MBK8352173.1 transcription antitermination factor NusB [Saprospirales bacterium]MBP6659981.1 transcription antitermination factor NusB [Chitinophagales bacterium]
MITRRSVRIKAMQYIYACETANSADIKHFEQNLQKSIFSVKDQYLYLLLFIREIANFAEKDAQIKSSKHLKSNDDKLVNTKLLSNFLIQFLNNDAPFLKEIKALNILSLIDEEDVRRLYKKMLDAPQYQHYLNNGKEFDIDEDRKIVLFMLNELLFEDDTFIDHSDEIFINWNDDAEFVVEAVTDIIQKSKHELKLHLNRQHLKEKMAELSQFGIDLFRETVEHKKENYKLIEPRLKNWDSDRLATVDIILMRMALSEFLYFPSIPIKVTINEYLDIAKEYSTPKSKDFINGVLDALMKDLKDKNLLNKIGRGLL